MQVGEMRDRITLMKPIPQTGAVIDLSDEAFEDYVTIWAKTEYFSNQEIYKATAVNVLDSLKFIVRYRTDITSDMRIKFDGIVYEIKGIRPLDKLKMNQMIVAEVYKHE